MGHRRARHFYPRSPCGERLYNRVNNRCAHCISIHALLAESDRPGLFFQYISHKFLSTLSLRRATTSRNRQRSRSQISIHALLAESDALAPEENPTQKRISIHALLAESDLADTMLHTENSISIHALLAESDLFEYIQAGTGILFLSTLSLRRATLVGVGRMNNHINFYPRSPCGERPPSIFRHCTTYLFLSTLSLRRATTAKMLYNNHTIHYFYPRSPCGERHIPFASCRFRPSFLSTLSLRRATSFAFSSVTLNSFLSTLSLRRATIRHRIHRQFPCHFYPRSPCGERHDFEPSTTRRLTFLSTLSLRRATAGPKP